MRILAPLAHQNGSLVLLCSDIAQPGPERLSIAMPTPLSYLWQLLAPPSIRDTDEAIVLQTVFLLREMKTIQTGDVGRVSHNETVGSRSAATTARLS